MTTESTARTDEIVELRADEIDQVAGGTVDQPVQQPQAPSRGNIRSF